MIFLLTDHELRAAIEALQHASPREGGLHQVDLALGHHRHKEASDHGDHQLPNLTFSPSSRTVHCGSLSARLSPTQFSLLQYVYAHGRASFEDVQDTVWGKEVSDDSVYRACSKLNVKLMDGGFSCELLTHHSHVSLEEMA
jgi:DNA-binding response OmpR family regulator